MSSLDRRWPPRAYCDPLSVRSRRPGYRLPPHPWLLSPHRGCLPRRPDICVGPKFRREVQGRLLGLADPVRVVSCCFRHLHHHPAWRAINGRQPGEVWLCWHGHISKRLSDVQYRLLLIRRHQPSRAVPPPSRPRRIAQCRQQRRDGPDRDGALQPPPLIDEFTEDRKSRLGGEPVSKTRMIRTYQLGSNGL